VSNREFKTLIAFGVFLLAGSRLGADRRPRWPTNGYVPDEKTAVRVAEAVLGPIFGDELIRSEEPFTAKLSNGVWVVRGTVPEGVNGGAAEIKISKKTCEIVSVIHEQ
jgi:hypothetical protein